VPIGGPDLPVFCDFPIPRRIPRRARLSSKNRLRYTHFSEPNAGGLEAENPNLSRLLHLLLVQNLGNREPVIDEHAVAK